MAPEVATKIVRTHAVMGTKASVHVHDQTDVATIDAAIAEMWAELDRLAAIFSTFRATSDISRNRDEMHLLDASDEVIEVVDACTWLEQVSGGAFHARRPGDAILDPAGFVKGWSAERAVKCLDRAGLQHWYMSIGGDIQTRGTAHGGMPWRVAIVDPTSEDPRAVRALVEVSGDAVATSGTAARGLHLWNGRIGEPPHELASMTVVGPHLTWADAFATTAFVMGLEGIDWVTNFDGYRALAITADGEIVRREDQWGRPRGSGVDGVSP